jgi:hypothetical protein
MQRLPAASGLQWIRDGFALFRRQPNQLSLLFLLYVTLNLMMAVVVPPIGSLVLVLVNQVFITSFMLGCAYADAGRPVRPKLLFAYLKKPIFMRLTGLGVCYLLAQLVAAGAMFLYSDGTLVDALAKAKASAPGTVDLAAQELVMRSLFFGMSVYVILIFPLWFAAPLIAWQEMGVAKAIFFSFFSVLRAIKAFIAYVLAWFAIVLFMSINLTALISLMPSGGNAFALLLLVPCTLFLSMLYFLSFYTSYVELFGEPALPPQE